MTLQKIVSADRPAWIAARLMRRSLQDFHVAGGVQQIARLMMGRFPSAIRLHRWLLRFAEEEFQHCAKSQSNTRRGRSRMCRIATVILFRDTPSAANAQIVCT